MADTPRADPVSAKPPIGIIGGGLMGHGIAQVFAQAGYDVRVYDAAATIRASVQSRIRDNLTILRQPLESVDHVSVHAKLSAAVEEAHFVFECGPENLEVKQSIFAEIERSASPSAIIGSNTSVIPITGIVQKLQDSRRALGTHWWNPPYLIPLVEVIRAAQTAEESMTSTIALLQAVGKTAVRVEKDVPGFVGNRLQHALWREAIALVQEGVCDAATVDMVVKSSFGRRLAVLGPLENSDMVGTELTLAIHDALLPHLDRSTAALPLLRQMVTSGRLGMKSGEGFRHWSREQQGELQTEVLHYLQKFDAEDRSRQ